MLLLVAGGVPPSELWRGPAGQECNLRLINEAGGVRVSAGSPAATAPAVTGSQELTIDAATNLEQTTLTVARQEGTASGIPAPDVELSVPPGCRVAIETADGSVAVDIGPDAFPLAVDTVTGSITVRADPAAGAAITLATSGEITTDYTIAIEFRYHEEPAKQGRIVIGSEAEGDATGASAEIQLRSRRGAVSVLRPAAGSGRP